MVIRPTVLGYISLLYNFIFISDDEEVGIDGWNSMEDCYAFLYSKEEKGKKKRVLVKCLVIGELLAIDVLDLEAQNEGPHNIQIKYVWILQLLFLMTCNYI